MLRDARISASNNPGPVTSGSGFALEGASRSNGELPRLPVPKHLSQLSLAPPHGQRPFRIATDAAEIGGGGGGGGGSDQNTTSFAAERRGVFRARATRFRLGLDDFVDERCFDFVFVRGLETAARALFVVARRSFVMREGERAFFPFGFLFPFGSLFPFGFLFPSTFATAIKPRISRGVRHPEQREHGTGFRDCRRVFVNVWWVCVERSACTLRRGRNHARRLVELAAVEVVECCGGRIHGINNPCGIHALNEGLFCTHRTRP